MHLAIKHISPIGLQEALIETKAWDASQKHVPKGARRNQWEKKMQEVQLALRSRMKCRDERWDREHSRPGLGYTKQYRVFKVGAHHSLVPNLFLLKGWEYLLERVMGKWKIYTVYSRDPFGIDHEWNSLVYKRKSIPSFYEHGCVLATIMQETFGDLFLLLGKEEVREKRPQEAIYIWT